MTASTAMGESFLVAPKKSLSLDYLRTFLAVYRTGSFTAAAGLLGVSQPTVTNHIKLVESHFGHSMFERGMDGVEPTVAAHELAKTVHAPVDQLDRFVSGNSRDTQALRSVQIGGPRDIIGLLMIPALAQDAGRLPRLELVFGESRPMLEDLAAGRLDLVLSTVRPRDPAIASWPVADEEFWLVGAPGLRVEPGMRQFDGLPFVAYNDDLAIIRRYWNTVYNTEPRFDTSITVPDLHTVKAAVIAGFGISVLPSYLVVDDVESGALVRLDDADEPPINTVFLAARRPTLEARPFVARFAELLAARIKALQTTPDLTFP